MKAIDMLDTADYGEMGLDELKINLQNSKVRDVKLNKSIV